DTVAYAYQWYLGVEPISGATDSTLALSVAGNGDRGDRIHVAVTPSDGSSSGEQVSSAPVTVADSAPVIDSVSISPTGPKTNQRLTANVTSHDPDGETVTYAYQCYQ